MSRKMTVVFHDEELYTHLKANPAETQAGCWIIPMKTIYPSSL